MGGEGKERSGKDDDGKTQGNYPSMFYPIQGDRKSSYHRGIRQSELKEDSLRLSTPEGAIEDRLSKDATDGADQNY